MKEIFNHNNFEYVQDSIKKKVQVVQNNVKQNVNTVRRRWYLWVFPFIALGMSTFLFYRYFYDHGPMIKIIFDEASVIQVEKTHLRFRGVDIGKVKEIAISEDRKNVEVSVLLVKGAEQFAVEGSKFWIVSPRVSLQGFTGLDTIFSGPYIETSPGPSSADPQLVFKGRQDPEAADATENTSVYFVEAVNGESLNAGDAVTYRGLNVGTIGKVGLSKSGQVVEVRLNIQNRYARLIRSNTIFWRKVGVQADLGLFGSKVQVNSLDSIMHGGIEFSTPDNAGPMAKARAKFLLATEAPKNAGNWKPVLE